MSDILGGSLDGVGTLISAIGALGTAAYGLVDASKCCRGGPSNHGYGDIKKALAPFKEALSQVPQELAWQTLYANWINGVASADQKAAAKGLIRLGMSPKDKNDLPALAKNLAAATNVDADVLQSAITKAYAGDSLALNEVNVLGKFDATVSAILDAAYERADQHYRNYTKAWAMLVSVVLAGFAGWLLALQGTTPPANLAAYLTSRDFVAAFAIGLVATPLAPVAKDLSTALTTAVKALQATKG